MLCCERRGFSRIRPKLDFTGYSEPEMVLEVFDQENTDKLPVEQALIAEYIFRRTIEESIPSGIAAVDQQGRQILFINPFSEFAFHSQTVIIFTIRNQ